MFDGTSFTFQHRFNPIGGVAYVNVTSKDSGSVLFVLVSLLKMVPRAEV